jgi:D-arabinose 1-dehydrogenase-like Zn-dependent alcohol dehydrogenase
VLIECSHSDLMHYNRTNETPITLGHEGVGIIEKIHPSAESKGFSIGDAVGCGYFLDWYVSISPLEGSRKA